MSRPQLLLEAKILNNLNGTEGFTKVLWSGTELGYNFVAIELLGKNLDSLFESQNKKFSVKTVLLLVEQMLTRIEELHAHGYIHRDLKPENWLMGVGENEKKLYLIDFGLSKRYRNDKTHQHIPFRDDCNLTGTARYCSINAHHSEQSRRDDLESLGYILVYFLKGKLPWQGISRGVPSGHMSIIEQTKIHTSLDTLCSELPIELSKYIDYCRSLDFKDKPDYKFLHRLFQKLAGKIHIQYDSIYDWDQNGLSPIPPLIDNNNQLRSVHSNEKNDSTTTNATSFDEDELCDKCPLCLWRSIYI